MACHVTSIKLIVVPIEYLLFKLKVHETHKKGLYLSYDTLSGCHLVITRHLRWVDDG